MAIQSTPHTESQQNKSESQTEMSPNQIAERIERDGDAGLYAHTDGAQTGMNRAERVTDGSGPKHKVEPGASAETGATSAQVGDAATQGVTNHSQQAEHAGQVKVMKEREDASARQEPEERTGDPVRDAVKEGGDLPKGKAESVETVEISAMRAVR